MKFSVRQDDQNVRLYLKSRCQFVSVCVVGGHSGMRKDTKSVKKTYT